MSHNYEKEVVKRGRRKHGVFLTLPNGKRAYVMRRRHKDIYRSGEKTISGALRGEVAGWTIDHETMVNARSRYIEYIGVYERDTGTLYLTKFENFSDSNKFGSCVFRNASRYLPMQFWQIKQGGVKI